MKTYTPEEIESIVKQRNALARCVIFAVNHFKLPSGSGTVMRFDAKGNMTESEYWVTWFRRELLEVGVTWDDELLNYARANKKERALMLRESTTLKAKLEANQKSKSPTP